MCIFRFPSTLKGKNQGCNRDETVCPNNAIRPVKSESPDMLRFHRDRGGQPRTRGYRPCVGMVGGKIFFRGPHRGFSQADAKLAPVTDEDWAWLSRNLAEFLARIKHGRLFKRLSAREDWQCIAARQPMEKVGVRRRSMSQFHRDVWDKELGRGGLIGGPGSWGGAGAVFRYPCFTKEITEQGVALQTGELIPADTVVISIGDLPDLGFLPGDIATDRGFVLVNDLQQTSDPRVFAIGDIVKPGLLTDAIGAGRKAAGVINEIASGKRPEGDRFWLADYAIEYSEPSERIDYSRMTLEYFDPRVTEYHDLSDCATQCSSCGSCMDCGLCEVVCPTAAIQRRDLGQGKFERVSNPDKCIGCGFCGKCCPCGVWGMVENSPLG